MKKGPSCWSYHQVVISPVITFMVCDTSELCKDVQVVTEILADTKTERMGGGVGGESTRRNTRG